MDGQLRRGAYEFLRSRILSGELPPLSRIKEQGVAAQLNLSRTPVREALARLEMEGLVRRGPGRGTIVCPVELDEVDEIYELRATLESLVARRACERATEAEIEEMAGDLRRAQECLETGNFDSITLHTVHFHALLNRSSRSPRLIALLRTLEDRLVSFRLKGMRYPGRAQSAMRQHWGILEGLRRRDVGEMCRWIEAHAEEGRVVAINTHLEEGRRRRMVDYAVQAVDAAHGAGPRVPD